MMIHASLTVLLMLAAQLQSPDRSERPPCLVATDDQYAYSREQPVQVGGSPMYGAARQRRYLDALRGPAGQPVQYKRRGAEKAADGTIVDAYELTYEGIPKPVTIFLDWYHFNPQKAPLGFSCGAPIALTPPPVDPFQESTALQRTAVELGRTRDFDPIPLSVGATDGGYGVMYDRFRIIARASRAAAAAGSTLDPETLPRELLQRGLVIVAYPQTCGDKRLAPKVIDIVAANGAVMPKTSQQLASGAGISELVPGLSAPDGSIAVALPFAVPNPALTMRITYGEGCGGASDQINLKAALTPLRVIDMTPPTLPADAPSAEPVLLQVLVDVDGQARHPVLIGGPKELLGAASDAVAKWKIDPVRVNGAPIATGALLRVQFPAK